MTMSLSFIGRTTLDLNCHYLILHLDQVGLIIRYQDIDRIVYFSFNPVTSAQQKFLRLECNTEHVRLVRVNVTNRAECQ